MQGIYVMWNISLYRQDLMTFNWKLESFHSLQKLKIYLNFRIYLYPDPALKKKHKSNGGLQPTTIRIHCALYCVPFQSHMFFVKEGLLGIAGENLPNPLILQNVCSRQWGSLLPVSANA